MSHAVSNMSLRETQINSSCLD